VRGLREAARILVDADSPGVVQVKVAALCEGVPGLLGMIAESYGIDIKGLSLYHQLQALRYREKGTGKNKRELGAERAINRHIYGLHWIREASNMVRHNDVGFEGELSYHEAVMAIELLLDFIEWYYCKAQKGPRWATIYTDEPKRPVTTRERIDDVYEGQKEQDKKIENIMIMQWQIEKLQRKQLKEIQFMLEDSFKDFQKQFSQIEQVLKIFTPNKAAIILNLCNTAYRELIHGRSQETIETILRILGLLSSELEHSQPEMLLKLKAYLFEVLGFEYVRIKDYKQGIKYLEESNKIARSKGLSDPVMFTEYQLGWTYIALSNFHTAILHLKRLLETAKKFNNVQYQGSAYNLLGMAYFYNDDLQRSLYYFKKALLLENHNSISIYDSFQIRMHLGKIYIEQKNYSEAIALFNEARELAEKIGYDKEKNKYSIMECYSQLAFAYYRNRNYFHAMTYLEIALELAREVKSPFYEIWILELLGWCCIHNSKYSEAEKAYKEVLALARRKMGDKETLPILEILGFINIQRLRFRKAAEYLNRALVIAQNNKNPNKVKKIKQELKKCSFIGAFTYGLKSIMRMIKRN